MRAGIGPLGWTVGRGDGLDITWAVCTPDENFRIEDTPETTAAVAEPLVDFLGIEGFDKGSLSCTTTVGTILPVFREDTIDAFSLSISVLSTIHSILNRPSGGS